MKCWFALAVLSAVALVTGVVLPVSAVAGPVYPSNFCADIPAPCVVSATRNSVAVTSADPDWGFQVTSDATGGSNEVTLNVIAKTYTPYVLGLSSLTDAWVVTVDVGSVVPRVSDVYGSNVTVQRIDDGDGTYKVTYTMTPVIVADGCDQSSWPWTCPLTATDEWDGYSEAIVTDYDAWSNVTERNAMYGMDLITNISATSMPPEVVNDPTTGYQQLLLRLANPHFLADGTTVFSGNLHERIPNEFLTQAYGIDDPAALTGAGLVATVSGGGGGGTITVAQEPGGAAMIVDVVGMNFSARTLRIKRGVITPGRPSGVTADRKSPTKGSISFTAPSSRGSTITGFAARCIRGAETLSAHGSSSPVAVGGLTAGTSYACQVRAVSKAGPGAWSARVRMPA